jgi:hypothetical protein
VGPWVRLLTTWYQLFGSGLFALRSVSIMVLALIALSLLFALLCLRHDLRALLDLARLFDFVLLLDLLALYTVDLHYCQALLGLIDPGGLLVLEYPLFLRFQFPVFLYPFVVMPLLDGFALLLGLFGAAGEKAGCDPAAISEQR